MGGAIEVHSAGEGQGSAFLFTIPFEFAIDYEAQSRKSVSTMIDRPIHIALVDSYMESLTTYERALSPITAPNEGTILLYETYAKLLSGVQDFERAGRKVSVIVLGMAPDDSSQMNSDHIVRQIIIWVAEHSIPIVVLAASSDVTAVRASLKLICQEISPFM